jgi:hypothetical protein
MDTGMTNLGSGGEAKASPADRADTDPIGPADDVPTAGDSEDAR